jgi:glycosyltransferase involved in cell wall biosynthesis
VSERFAIAQVTPHPWEDEHEVGAFVRSLSEQLAHRGHRIVVLAPSRSPELVRESRRLIRAGDFFAADGDVRVLGVGELLPLSPARRGTPPAPPLDVARTLDDVLSRAPLDFVHVHEPFAPSTASIALRHSRALNVGTFHAPSERVISTQVARRFVERFFGRLDARTASFEATRELMEHAFPASYEVLRSGAQTPARAPAGDELRLAFVDHEDRQALRLFLRALRRLPEEVAWRATIFTPAGPRTGALRSRLRDRVEILTAEETTEEQVLAGADVVVAASTGQAPAPGVLVRALGAGAVPVAARLPAYEEVLCDGELGLLFERGDVETLTAQLSRLLTDDGLRRRLAAAVAATAPELAWSAVAARFESVYEGVAARRHRTRGDGAVRARLAARELIDVDLHMHTDHSNDCATPVDVLLATARDAGLGAIAVTDHNEVSGALDARAKAGRVRRQGDRRRGGQDRQPGRGDRALHRGEDRARDEPGGDDRGDQAPGRARVRAAPLRPHALRARLRAPARGGRGRRRDRGLQPAHRDPGIQRGGGALRGQVPDRRRGRLGLPRGAGARVGADPDARLRRARGVPGGARRRRHRRPPVLALLRPGAGAQVPPDPRDAARGRRAARRRQIARATSGRNR